MPCSDYILEQLYQSSLPKKSFWTTCESLFSWQVSRNNILQVCPIFPSKFKTEIHKKKKLCFQYLGMYSYSFFLILFGIPILFGRLISLLYEQQSFLFSLPPTEICLPSAYLKEYCLCHCDIHWCKHEALLGEGHPDRNILVIFIYFYQGPFTPPKNTEITELFRVDS